VNAELCCFRVIVANANQLTVGPSAFYTCKYITVSFSLADRNDSIYLDRMALSAMELYTHWDILEAKQIIEIDQDRIHFLDQELISYRYSSCSCR